MAKKFTVADIIAVEQDKETTTAPTQTSGAKRFSVDDIEAAEKAKEPLLTSMSIDNMMLGFGRNKLNAIESAIPDDVENRAKVDSAYDYLTTKELRGVDDDSPLDITRGDGLTEWITKNYDSVTGKPAEATKSMVLPAGGTMGGTTFIKGNEEEAKAALRAYDNDFLGSRNKMAEAIVNNLPLADEDSDDEDLKAQGRVMLGDQVFNRAEAIQAARRLVSETMHPTLLRSNKAYRDNYFISTTGKNFEDFKLDKVSEWSSKLAELEKVLSADVKSMSSAPSLFSATGISPQLAMAVKAEVEGMGALNKAREQIASLKDNDFFAGLDEGFDLVSMLTAGITTMGGNIKLNNVLDKVAEGKALTPSEKALYDVYGVQQEVEQMFGIQGRSGWNNIGLGVGGSAEVVLPMAAGMGAMRAIPGLATKALGTRTAYAAARQAFKKNTWRGLGEAIKQTAKVGGRTIANTGRATAGGLITAPFTPKMWSDFVEKRNEQYQLVDGKLEYTPTKAYKDLYGAIVDQTTEIASEIAGVGLSSFLRGGAKAFGRMLHLDDIADAMGIGLNTRSVFGWRKPNWWRVAEQNIGFSGALSEPLSEVWGDVMRNTMKAPFGMSNFAEMATADYWKTTFAVSAIYGGSLQLATVPARLAHIQQTMKLGGQAKRALSRIENTALRNNLLSIINNNDYESAAQQMAQIPWNQYSRPDVGYAMDYIAAELPRQVGLGYIEEDMRLNAFRTEANRLANLRYKGVNGDDQTNLIVNAVTPDGVEYTVESGDYNNLDDGLLIVRDANGVKMPMAKNKIATVDKPVDYSVTLQNTYTWLYSREVEEQRVQSVKDALAEMKEPTVEQVDLLMANNGFKEHSVGDIVALADGRTAEVLGRLPNGNYDLAITENGEATEYANAPFYDILSDAPMTRDAQIASYMRENGERAEKPTEVAPTEEVAEEMPTVGGFSVGEVVNTPNGKARITAFGDNGEVMVDMNLENTSNNPTAMALVGLTLDDISREVAPAETTTDATTEQVSVGEQTAEETPAEVESADTAPEIKSVPRLENGEVDYNAITDPDLYAEYFARDMGSKEAASAQMAKMIAATQSEVEKLAKKGDSLVDANAVVANNKEIARLNERINLYNTVQMALTPAPQVDTTAIAETPVEAQITAPIETVAEVEDTPIEAQTEVASGVVPNELSEGIATEHLAVVDAMAKMLGVRITFVPEVRDSNGNLQNAKIVGKDIYIAAGATQIETISFLTGHEFTHRMKELSPEQYAKLEDSVRNYLGNEAWEAEMATHTNTYRKVQRNITDEEIAEEVVADFIGRQVRDNNLFTQYLDSIKDKGLVDAIKSVLRAIRDFFRNINATAKDKALDEVISNLNTLIESASAKAESASAKAESAESTEAKFSARLSAEELDEITTERKEIRDTAKANGTWLKAPNGQPTNLTPKQWVEVRTKRFKAWFGDWEKAARIEKLRISENVSISGNEIVPSGDMKEYRKNALEYGKAIRGEYVNTDTGASIVINKDSLTEVLHHDGNNIAHIQSIAAIPQMVESGIYITSEPVSENTSKKLRNAKMAHYYVCGLNIGGIPYTVKFVVAEFESGEKYYDHSLTEIEKGELLNRAELSSTVAESKTPISDIKDKRLISILQTNSSKIVDANGEPKIVEHSTWNEDFYTFDIEHLGESSGDEGIYGAGFYFGNVGETKLYGDRAIQAYLNLHNPLVLSDAPIKGFFDYLVENFDKEGLRDIVVKQGNKTATMGDVLDAIKAVNEAHARGEYAELIEQMSQYWYPAEERVLEQQIFRKMGLAIYPTLEPFIQYNVGRKEFSKALRNAGYDGVVYDNQEYIAFEPNQIKSATENIGTYDANNPDIRYSLRETDALYTASGERYSLTYHGSGALFDHFSHAFMGTGEGAQAFGWGTYVTEVEGIGRTYAAAMGEKPIKIEINKLVLSATNKKDFIKSRKADIRRSEDYDKYSKTILKNRKHLEKELKTAQKEGNDKDVTFYEGLINITKQQLDRDYHKHLIDSFWEDINTAQAEYDELQSRIKQLKKELKGVPKYLYNVDIPDDNGNNYLDWVEPVNPAQQKMIADQSSKEALDDYRISYIDEDGAPKLNISVSEGQRAYNELSKVLGTPQAASEFLSRAGFVGISYPSQIITGGRDDNARNYVIFNEDDAKIVDVAKFSLRAYDENFNRKVSDSKAIAISYAIQSDIILTKSTSEFEDALREYGVNDIKETENKDAVYLDWVDKIIVNTEFINTPELMVETLCHENMHAITHKNKDAVRKVAGRLPLTAIMAYAVNKLGYTTKEIRENISTTSFEVVDEIISTFVERISTMPIENGGYVLRHFLGGLLSIDDVMSACEQGFEELFADKYNILANAVKPILRENLIKYRDERNRREKMGNTTIWNKSGNANEVGEGRMDEERGSSISRSTSPSRGESQIQGSELGESRATQEGKTGEVARYSLREQVANILDNYDTEGDEYGSMRDVADGVEAIIADAEEDTTALENIVNAYRYAQEEARSWGDRMDAGGDDDFELALRSYAYAGRERYSARESEHPFGSMRAREEAIAMAERGDYASDIYRKTGWYFDEKHNEWRGNTRLHNDRYMEMRHKEEEAMPFFEDGGDETYIWGDISEEIVESATYKSSEERILAHMKNRHLVARERIRQAAKEDIDNTRRIYNETNLKRNEGLGKRTTKAGKVAYILGDTAPESLEPYDQALVKIALDEVHISWDDIGNKRGLASELGLKKGEKRSYSNITKGATMGLEEFVHGWWQELGGYEKDIDTQDLRNALIEALGEVNRPTQALAALRQKFDTALAERDAVIERLEFDMEQALLAEDERYNNEVEGFKTSKDKRQRIADYERDVMLVDASEAMRGTISDMDKALADAKARLEASTTHSMSIRGKLGATTRSYNSLKRFADAIEEVKGKIREVVNNSAVLQFRRREINQLLDNLDKARSMEDIEYVSNRLQRLLLNISIRQEKANLNRLLNLRLPNGQFAEAWINEHIASGAISAADGKRILADMWRGTNNKGIRVARYVDGDTGAMLRYLRNSLIAPNARRFYEKVTDANGNVVLNEEGKSIKVLSPDLELAINVNKERENTEHRINEITVYLESGLTGNNQEKFELKTAMEYKGRELKPAYIVPPKIEREALYRYLQYLDLVEEKKTMADLRKEMDKMSKVLWYDDNATPKQKEEARTRLKTAFGALNASKMMYDNNLKEFNDSLAYLISSGRDAYKAFRDAQEEHRKEVVSEAVKAIGGEARLQPKSPTMMQNFEAKRWRRLLNNTYYSFQMILKDIDRYAPNGEGAFYNRYMNGATKANQTFIAMENTHFVMLADKVNKLWGEEFKDSNPFVSLMALKNVMEATRVGSITYKPKFNPDTDEYEGEESFPLVVPNAMYILALWWQPRYATGLARRGITEAQIEVIKQELNAIDPRLIKFMEWIRDEFLPGTRLEYNEVYRQIFGVDMDWEINYFPGNVVGRYEEVDVTSDTALNNNNGSTPKAIKARVDHTLMGDMAKNYFDVLIQHLQSMDYFYAYEQLRNDVNLVSSSAEFRGRLAAYKPGYKDAVHGEGGLFWLWRNTANIMLDQYRPVNNKNDELFFALQKGWATSNIAFRGYTALKQLASMPVFAAYSLDPECMKIFFREIKNVTSAIVRGHGKALYRATAAQFPTFRKRWTDRNAGIEWLAREGELNNANVNFERSKHPDLLVAADVLDRAINKLAIEWGMYPNALIDSLSVIVGLRTVDAFERYRMEKAKGRLTDEDIELAKIKAQIAINETQQSAEGAYLSVIQKDPGALWKPAVMYLNNTFANHRKRLAGLTELYRQWFDKEWLKEMERRYGDELGVELKSARKKAYADIMQGVISDVNFYILTAAGVLIPMWLNGDDDEERSAGSIWKETGISLLGNVLIGGFFGGNIVTGLISGYTPSPIPSWDEFERGGKKFMSEIRNDRWGAATYLAFEILMRNAVGVDLDTFANMVIGAQELLRGEGTVGMMKFLNIPQSQVDLIVGKKREGETVIEYINRRLRAETILRYSYEDIYTKSGKRTGVKPILMSTYTLNKLLSDYETAYRRQVVIREAGRSGWNDMLKIDEEYKDVVKAIGWTAEKNPNNKAFENKVYEAPVEGMTRKQYDKAAKLEEKIAEHARDIEKFVGTDEEYYSLVKEMTEYKKQLIDNYNELE